MRKVFLAVLLAASAGVSQAADTLYLRFSDLLRQSDVKSALQQDVTYYWPGQAVPEIAETYPPDTYKGTGSGGSSPDFANPRNCREAFVVMLRNITRSARTQGFDSVINLQGVDEANPAGNKEGVTCIGGRSYSVIELQATLGLTPEGKKKLHEKQGNKPPVANRPAAKDAIFLPVGPILASAEFKKILGENKAFLWGNQPAPVITERFGPESYTEYGYPAKGQGNTEMCTTAFLKAVENILSYADEYKHDSLIGVRSFLNDQETPDETVFECLTGRRYATVTLRATTARAK